ncbi:S8 family peptidase [Pseudofulvimonas gallinarii]|uniref:S8 family peptidase n=1 Tax=Pseudofulvimonas gallinarii TaxID=634155 RepID=UPI00109F480C|nr:S8 family serine peptidase [Pseudofulvimonas gallinarii]
MLLSTDPAAPTPDQVVNGWNFETKSPTPGLAVGSPVGAWYLLPLRASGDFKDLLEQQPNTPRARLERYIVVEYPDDPNAAAGMLALQADPNIEAVSAPISFQFSSATLQSFSIEQSVPLGGGTNYGWGGLNLGRAWNYAGGHSLIGVIDTGLQTNHPELRSFTPSGSFTLGNFLPVYSLNIGAWPDSIDTNVDERAPSVVQYPNPYCPMDGNGQAPIDFVGHGTHVSGLLAANAYDGTTVAGVCKNCGVAMYRIVYGVCVVGYGVLADFNSDAGAAAFTFLGDTGAQVISNSYGFNPWVVDCCTNYGKNPFCEALNYIQQREIIVVAASGNNRNWLDFPASDPRVVAAGGFDETLQLWDEDRDPPPAHLDDCPMPGFSDQCGSNRTFSLLQPKQEVVAAARQVYGAIYTGFNWNMDFGCGDSFGPGGTSDGYGNCTGTSMSAPQIAGVLGLLRSINSLVGAGDPENALIFGVRDVLSSTTYQAQAGISWGFDLGYGRPDVEAAAKRMLGKVAGTASRNRVTPLFSVYGSGAKDYAYTTSPHTAAALLINGVSNYVTTGTAVQGYPAFPPDPYILPSDMPRANTFIMTTEYKTRASYPDLVPLYLLDRERNYPIGCNPSVPPCNTNNRDYLLATGMGEVEALHAAGYRYRGIEGYVYQRCTPEPSCIPPGAEKLWRKCKTADDDCAVFLESQRTTFESLGYTATVPAGFPQHIGYAYPNVDTDGDGLIDGMEYVIGTSHLHADSDGDGSPDATEFPLAAVSNSDPCNGPLAGRCPADTLFDNGFQ